MLVAGKFSTRKRTSLMSIRTRPAFRMRSLVNLKPGFVSSRSYDLRHTAATLAAASGASLKALMARIGHASAAAALRYQHVIDGQDADIVRYLERFGEEPPVPTSRRAPADPQWMLDKAVKGGAEIVLPVTELPGDGDMARFRDPDGNVVGLVRSAVPA
jgi:hypothetical protein